MWMIQFFTLAIVLVNVYGECIKTECPAGWMKHGWSCYLISKNEIKTWFAAKAYCDEHNSTLAKLSTREELNWMYQQLLALNGAYNYWIGGNRLKNIEEWRWVSDGERLTLLDFEKGHQIINATKCITLWSQAEYSWRDQLCTASHGFICKSSCMYN